MKRNVVFGLVAVLMMLLAVFLASRRPTIEVEGMRVAASIYPLADMVRSVGGPHVQVQAMVAPGASPHTFEPTPAQLSYLNRSRIYFQIGLDLEFWWGKLLESLENPDLVVVEVSKGIIPRRFGTPEGPHESAGAQADPGREERVVGEFDPHVWLDPMLAKTVIDNIVTSLSEVDPPNAESYRRNGENYRRELDTINAEYEAAVAQLPVKSFVAFHSAYAYLAERYGLQVAAVIEESPGKEPSPQHLQRVIERIRASGTRLVFVEPQFNPKVAEAIARDAGAKVVVIDPIGSPEDPERSSYLGMMRANLKALMAGGGAG